MRKRILIAACVGIAAGGAARIAFSGPPPAAISAQQRTNWYREIELFADTLAIVQRGFVDEVKPKDLIYGALKGMMASLDSHSQFLDPDSLNALKTDTEGKFGGIGLEIGIKDDLLTVITPVEDSPAWKAGVKAGDKILKIDDAITRDMTLTDAVKRMRGAPGTTVALIILREVEKEVMEIKIVRDIIKIRDIKEAQIIDDKIGYLRLVEFREDSPQELNAAIDKLSNAGMTGIILDLRNNPGGLLDVAVQICERFINPGKVVVTTKGKKKTDNMEFIARGRNPLLDIPMVVLINNGSASGSEIVAGCLQDYRRAIIVGTTSYGKGSVQTVIPLGDGSGLRLTTSKYLTPLGHVIHNKGVIPDIVVEQTRIETKKNDAAPGVDTDAEEIFNEIEHEEAEKSKPDASFKYHADNQLMHAIDVIKAARFYSGPGAQSHEKK